MGQEGVGVGLSQESPGARESRNDGRCRGVTITWVKTEEASWTPRSGSKVEDRMPTYEYRCRDCHHNFERVESLADHGRKRPDCPKCKGKNVEQVFTPFFAKTSHKS